MKKKRKRERTVLQTIGMAVAVSFVTALAIAAVMFSIQYSDLRILYDLLSNNQSGETPRSELFLKLNYYLAFDEIILTSVSLAVGSLVLGKIGPSKLNLPKTLGASAAASLIVLLASLGFIWGEKLYFQHGKLAPSQITPQYLEMQSTFIVIWIIVGLIGAWAGYIWKMKTTSSTPPTPVTQKTKQSVA